MRETELSYDCLLKYVKYVDLASGFIQIGSGTQVFGTVCCSLVLSVLGILVLASAQ